MKLRWFVVCDKQGNKTEPDLQYWNSESNTWDYVDYCECKTWEQAEYRDNEFYTRG